MAVVGALGAAFVQSRPSRIRIVRELKLSATPEQILPHIADFTNWRAWSPWAGRDPSMKLEISQPPTGVGATYHWSGNKEVGEGRMTITEMTSQSVTIDLEFIRPFPAKNITTFTLFPQGDGTVVQWQMEGPQVFVSKLMGLLIDMDKMIGKDFEKGLTSLQSIVAAS